MESGGSSGLAQTKSILESDLFKNREVERERMIKMFTNEPTTSLQSINDRAVAGTNSIVH